MSAISWALGAALIDFLWQGTAIALVSGLVLTLLRQRSAQVRYAVACGALAALTVAPVVTTLSLLTRSSEPLSVSAPVAATPVAHAAPSAPVTMLPISMVADSPQAQWLATAQSWAFPLWVAGVLLLSVRLGAGSIQAFITERRAVAGDNEIRAMVQALARRLGLRQTVRVLVSPAVDGLGVIGWLKPVLLLPPAFALGLTTEQVEALLAHELAHVRRHDYAVNVLQCLAETLLFYHPGVWWISRQVRIERELCCDDLVVRACGNPTAYARGLTILAKRQLSVPAYIIPATGGALAYRVRRLLGVSTSRVPSLASGLGVLGVVLVCVAGNIAWAQARAQQMPDISEFVVASVKPNTPWNGQVRISGGGNRLTVTGMNVTEMIRLAYQLQEFQIIGAPEWAEKDRYDIVATVDAEAARAKWPDAPGPQRMMGRAILKARFGLMVHKETREMPVFALVYARSDRRLGPKLTPSALNCVPGPSEDRRCGGGGISTGRMTARGATMTKIAELFALLSNADAPLNRLVVDDTGLEGFYDMDLSFTPQVVPPPGGEPFPGMAPFDPNAPTIFTAIQEQLGLKLEPRRGPAEVLVIDHVEKPSPD